MSNGAAVHHAQSLIGSTLFTYEMPIERGKVLEFARATGAGASEYFHTDAPIPPTFLTSAMHWEPREPALVDLLGIDLTRVLQGGQEYRFFGELPRCGEVLHAATSVDSVEKKEGKRGGTMTVIVVLTRFSRPDGSVAAEGRSTVIERAKS